MNKGLRTIQTSNINHFRLAAAGLIERQKQ